METNRIYLLPMMRINKLLFITSLIAFSLTNASAQSQNKSLKVVLESVAKQFSVHFNYTEDLVENKFVKPPRLNLGLHKIIDDLRQQTKLNFNKLDQTTYIISKRIIQDNNQVNLLNEVLLSAYLTKGISKQSDASIVIEPKQLSVLPGLVSQDAFQAIQYLPGISSVKQNLNNINVRGGTHDQNAFYWQGVRLYQTSHFFGMISSINPLLANKIQIYKTAAPANYNEGVSSVIDFKHDFSKPSNYSFQSSTNFLDASLSYQFNPSLNSKLMVAGRTSLTGFLDTPTYKEYSKKIFQSTDLNLLQQQNNIGLDITQKLRYYDFAFNYELVKNNFKFHLDGLVITNQLTYEETSTDIETKSNEISQSNALLSFQVDYNFSKKHQIQASANLSYYNLEAENRITERAQQLEQANLVLDYNLNITDHLSFNDWKFLSAFNYRNLGVRNNNISISPDAQQLTKNVLSSQALITEVVYKKPKFKFRLGNRLKLYSNYNQFIIEPRLHINYKISSTVNLMFNVEQKYQALYQRINLQQDFLGLENKRWVLADENGQDLLQNLQTELDLSITKSNFQFNIKPFFKRVQQINSKSQGFQNQLETFQLFGNYESFGLESLWQYRIKENRFWLSYTYQSNKYNFSDFNPQRFPNNYDISHQINFGNSIELNQLQLALGGTFFTGKPYTPINASNSINPDGAINFLNPNTKNLENFLQLNFTAAYAIKHNKSNITFGVALLNILGSDNNINRYFELNSTESDIIQFNTKSIGFTPNLFLNLKL